MDTLTVYENESNTSPFRQGTLSKHHSKLRNVLSLERKVFLDSLMVVLTVVEAIQFPLEIRNPNASHFWTVLLNDAKLYLSLSARLLRDNLYNAHAWLCPDFVFVLSRSDYIDIPEYAMLRVSLPKTPGPAEV